MKLKILTTIFVLSIFFSTALTFVFAADPIVVSPTSNISGDTITLKNFQINLEYGHNVVLDGSSSINLYENGVLVAKSHSVDGTKIHITKTTDYLPYKTYRLMVNNVDSSDPDVSFNDFDITFHYSSYATFEVGRSVNGRIIYGYSIGEGSQKYLLIGGIHGNEKNSVKLVEQLLRNFELDPGAIPADSKIIFVPKLNPDGFRTNNRLNARGVDLNRNSNTSNWRRTTYWGSTKLTNGGGSKPNSEPETRAIQLLIKVHDPYLTISYHSAAGYALTNGPSSRSITKAYAGQAKYEYIDQSSGGVGFGYAVTGDLTNWIYEKLGYRAMTIELKSKEYTEVSGNLKALKYILSRY